MGTPKQYARTFDERKGQSKEMHVAGPSMGYLSMGVTPAIIRSCRGRSQAFDLVASFLSHYPIPGLNHNKLLTNFVEKYISYSSQVTLVVFLVYPLIYHQMGKGSRMIIQRI